MSVQRIIIGALLLVLAFITLFLLPPWGFVLVAALVTLGVGWEWSQFLSTTSRWQRFIYAGLILLLALASRWSPLELTVAIPYFWWLIACRLVLTYPFTARLWQRIPLLLAIMGILAIIPAYSTIIILYNYRPALLSLLFILVWGADIGAYFAGHFLGRRKLLAKVSPEKTWEGVIGGMLLYSS